MIRCLKFSFPPSVSASCASTVKLPADLWLLSFVFFPPSTQTDACWSGAAARSTAWVYHTELLD